MGVGVTEFVRLYLYALLLYEICVCVCDFYAFSILFSICLSMGLSIRNVYVFHCRRF